MIKFNDQFINNRNKLIKKYLTYQLLNFNDFYEFINHLYLPLSNDSVTFIHMIVHPNSQFLPIEGISINYPIFIDDNGSCQNSYYIDDDGYSYTDLIDYTNNLYTICSVNNTNKEYEEVVIHHNESNRRLNVMSFYLKNIIYEVNVIEIIL